MTRDDLLAYLRDDLNVDVSGLTDTSPLFSSGVIDSFSLVNLITFVEKSCGFRVSPMDVNLDNMDSVERLLAYIERSGGGAGA